MTRRVTSATTSALPDRNERGEWSLPTQMQKTYSLLYNANNVNGSSYLPTLMDEDLWRLVFGPSVRPRNKCWAASPAELFNYRSTRTSDSSDGAAESAPRPQKRARPASELLTFSSPVRNRDGRTGRSFEVQHDEGILCPMHALNNVANAVVLTPPDVMQAIEMVRTLAPPVASLEELVLAALREGIVLLQIKLTDASDLNPLNAQLPYPAAKSFLTLVEEARGMIIYTPAPGYGGIGHYVSLVYTEPPEGGLPAETRWLIYSTSQVIERGATASEALDNYIMLKLGTGVSAAERAREANRRKLQERNIVPQYFIGLLPLPIHMLWDDANAGALRDVRIENGSLENYLRTVMMRSLLRRSLSEMRLQARGDGSCDIVLPRPVTPNALDELYLFLSRNTRRADNATQWHGIFNGADQSNVSTLILARHEIDVQLNYFADALARVWLDMTDRGWPELVAAADHLPQAARRQIERRNATLVTDYTAMYEQLGELRRVMREPDGGLGLMFTDLAPHNQQVMFQQFQRLITNRRWLRYLVIDLVAAALDTHVRDIVARQLFPLGVAERRVVALLIVCAFTSLRAVGINPSTTPHVTRLLNYVRAARVETLPLDALPPMLVHAVRDVGAVNAYGEDAFNALMISGGYEWYLWLLQSAVNVGLPGLATMSLAPFWAMAPFEDDDQPAYDDLSVQYDRMASFVTLLRVTLFAMPAGLVDFSLVHSDFYAQDWRAPTRPAIAQHLRYVATQFVERAVYSQIISEPATALAWLSWIGCDPRYGTPDDVQWRAAAADVASHLLDDDLKPMFVERALQAGFDQLRRRNYGALYTQPDMRAPIRTNINRVPLPAIAGNWLATRPTLDSRAQLCVTPLTALRLWTAASGQAVSRRSAPRSQTLSSLSRMAVDDDADASLRTASTSDQLPWRA